MPRNPSSVLQDLYTAQVEYDALSGKLTETSQRIDVLEAEAKLIDLPVGRRLTRVQYRYTDVIVQVVKHEDGSVQLEVLDFVYLSDLRWTGDVEPVPEPSEAELVSSPL